eukprot:COSAG02_NODE_16816_length_1053_cov_7.693576_1_plen_87_part_00
MGAGHRTTTARSLARLVSDPKRSQPVRLTVVVEAALAGGAAAEAVAVRVVQRHVLAVHGHRSAFVRQTDRQGILTGCWVRIQHSAE